MLTTFITNTILQNLINFLAPVIAIAIIVFCVIQGVGIFKGSNDASWKKLLTGVVFLFLILGIMYAAGSFNTYGQLFKSITDQAITSGTNDINTIIGGGGE